MEAPNRFYAGFRVTSRVWPTIVFPRTDKRRLARRQRIFSNLAVDERDDRSYPIATPVAETILTLVVGCDASDVSATAEVIRDAGFDVAEATSFEQARTLLASLDPDLLITEVQLGAFNGLHLVWQRHLEQPGRPSIVLSAYADSVLEAEANRLGAPFLVTSVEPDTLIAVVDSLPGLRRHDIPEKRQWTRLRVESELGLVLAEGPATSSRRELRWLSTPLSPGDRRAAHSDDSVAGTHVRHDNPGGPGVAPVRGRRRCLWPVSDRSVRDAAGLVRVRGWVGARAVERCSTTTA